MNGGLAATTENGGWTNMKKKLLLLALPALMVLTSCGRVNNQPVEKQLNNLDGVVEDTLAHEDVFGGAAVKGPAIRKIENMGTGANYKVGYQIHFDNKENDDPSDDRISIRFVAAIQSSYASMTWTRGVTNGVGAETKPLSNHRYDEGLAEDVYFNSSVIYDSIANGAGNDVMTKGVGEYADYSGFIVYSLLNIPYKANKDSYVGVTLTLHPSEGDDVVTPFYAVKIKKNAGGTASSDAFSFSNNKSGFFLAGTISGRTRTVNSDSSFKGDNAAAFDTDFVANDNFLIVQKESSMFKIWDSRCITSDPTNGTARFFEDDDGRIKVASGGDIRLFLNGSDELWSDSTSPYTRTRLSEEHGGLFVRGFVTTGADDWDCKDGFELKSDRKDYAVLFHAYFHTGEFKIACSDWAGEEFNYITGGDKAGNFEDGVGSGNANCLTEGYYDIYINTHNPREVYIFMSE